jgi:hypothetical protein
MRKPRLRAHRRRAAILGVLAEHGPLSAYEITVRTGRWSSVYDDLGKLEKVGQVASGLKEAPNGSSVRYWRLSGTSTPMDAVVYVDDAQATLARAERALTVIRDRAEHGPFLERAGLEVAGDLLWDALHGTKGPTR